MSNCRLLFLLLPSIAAAQLDTTGLNAATVYGPIFSNTPSWATAPPTIAPDRSSIPAPLEDPAAAYKEMQELLAALRVAGQATHCNWGTRFEDGYAAQLPYLGPARSSARAILWAAKYALANDPSSFIEHALAALRLGRNVGEDQIDMSFIVQCEIEVLTLELLTENIDRLDRRQLDQLTTAFKDLPPGASMADCARMNKAFLLDQLMKKTVEAMAEPDTNVFTVLPASFATDTTNRTGHAEVSSFANDLRLASVVESGLKLWIGFVSAEGESFTISRGHPSHGIELLSADVARGEALIARGAETALVKVKKREIVPVRLRFRTSTPAGHSIFSQILVSLGYHDNPADLKALVDPNALLAVLHKTSEEYDEWIGAMETLPPKEFRAWQDSLLTRGTVFTRSLIGNGWEMTMAIERDLLAARARLETALAARRAHLPQ